MSHWIDLYELIERELRRRWVRMHYELQWMLHQLEFAQEVKHTGTAEFLTHTLQLLHCTHEKEYTSVWATCQNKRTIQKDRPNIIIVYFHQERFLVEEKNHRQLLLCLLLHSLVSDELLMLQLLQLPIALAAPISSAKPHLRLCRQFFFPHFYNSTFTKRVRTKQHRRSPHTENTLKITHSYVV